VWVLSGLRAVSCVVYVFEAGGYVVSISRGKMVHVPMIGALRRMFGNWTEKKLSLMWRKFNRYVFFTFSTRCV
jgi:hypothetical protein